MLFRREVLDRIRSGKVRVAYRRWTRPSVKAGGTLRTPIGVLTFTRIRPVALSDLDERRARAAGSGSIEKLITELNRRPGGRIYEIAFRRTGADPRLALRERATLSAEELRDIVARLDRFDRRAPAGPWTRRVLSLICRHPGVRSADAAPKAGFRDVLKYKVQVRKLKELGLTVSLGTGYRLSPRGETLLSRM